MAYCEAEQASSLRLLSLRMHLVSELHWNSGMKLLLVENMEQSEAPELQGVGIRLKSLGPSSPCPKQLRAPPIALSSLVRSCSMELVFRV